MNRRRPTIFEIDEVAFEEDSAFDEAPRETYRARPQPDEGFEAEEAAPLPVPIEPEPLKKRRRITWLSLFTMGISGLAALALSISLYAFVEDLLARIPALGWVAAALTAVMLLGLLGMVGREWIALRRLKEVESLRRRADEAVINDDRHQALAALKELIDLYDDRPVTARGRKAMKGHMREIIDGRDLIALGEREILGPLDREAIAEIVGTARRVAAVTALSPRALVDLAFVIFAALSLVRRIATIYGGRPGTLGFLRVLRHAIAHLAVTGGMAAGDSLVGEVIGKGIAAKLSAKLGEGIVNGLMTARLGLATLDVLRPLPFTGTRRPRINDILPEIARIVPRSKDGKE
ncbi:YcjF family protein [Acuticoccus kandeliae]|uniref:YcjF family protein n=1 Tax=Acuticoccus kandeliae TaxID=2073160 RepID=UPI00196AA9AF|nr:TIGR01620 family protein [Acuticoccus kandeliae]